MINNQYYQNLISWSEDLRNRFVVINKFISKSNEDLNEVQIYNELVDLQAFTRTAPTNQEHQYFIYQIHYWINVITREMRNNGIFQGFLTPGFLTKNKNLCLHYEMISEYIDFFQQKLKREFAYVTNAFEALESLSVMFEVK